MYKISFNSLRLSTLLISLILISACSRVVVIEQQQELLPKVIANSELTCPETNLTRCSIASPLHDLADHLFSSSNPKPLNHATIIDIGEKSLTARIHLIRAARRSIDVQTYLWNNDDIGSLFIQELLSAAKRGVKVRIIADQLYSGNVPENLAAIAQAHENFQVRLYNPFNQKASVSTSDFVKSIIFDFSRLNHRMHNKLMVFDERIGVTGGRNISNEYYDWNTKFNFIDRDVLVIGKAVTDMDKSFHQYWIDPITVDLDQLADVRAHLFVGDVQQLLSLPDSFKVKGFGNIIDRAVDNEYITSEFINRGHKVSDIIFTADRPQKPFVENDEADVNVTKNIADSLKSAKHSIIMQTPYFIISDPAYKLFKQIRKDNPDIDYAVSTNSLASVDHYPVYSLAFKRKKRNVKNLKFKIYELKPHPTDIQVFMPRYPDIKRSKITTETDESFDYDPEESMEFERYETVAINNKDPRASIHAKSIVIDKRTSIIGSHNFDPRGIAINTETSLIVRDEAFANELSDSIKLTLQSQNSWVIGKRQRVPFIGHITDVFESVSRILPVFDLWPFRYTSSFELREGMQAVSIDDPNFYKHYKDVGQFPGTSLNDDQIKTILVSAFGSVAEPLM
jgi:cardiolipin synthase C